QQGWNCGDRPGRRRQPVGTSTRTGGTRMRGRHRPTLGGAAYWRVREPRRAQNTVRSEPWVSSPGAVPEHEEDDEQSEARDFRQRATDARRSEPGPAGQPEEAEAGQEAEGVEGGEAPAHARPPLATSIGVAKPASWHCAMTRR